MKYGQWVSGNYKAFPSAPISNAQFFFKQSVSLSPRAKSDIFQPCGLRSYKFVFNMLFILFYILPAVLAMSLKDMSSEDATPLRASKSPSKNLCIVR